MTGGERFNVVVGSLVFGAFLTLFWVAPVWIWALAPGTYWIAGVCFLSSTVVIALAVFAHVMRADRDEQANQVLWGLSAFVPVQTACLNESTIAPTEPVDVTILATRQWRGTGSCS